MLGRISEALAGIGQLADLVQPLYITVDPERDTPTVMRDFLQASFPLFTGLTGTLEQIERIKNVYKVFAQKKADELDPDGYAVPHTAFVYLIGPDGQYQTHFSDATEVAKMAERLRSILSNI
jgi:protein SCO1/2